MKPLNLAFQFLTKLSFIKNYPQVSDKDLANSIIFYPVVGAFYGAVLYFIAFLLPSKLPLITIGILLVVCEFLLSGGLHYDGLSDLADGWFSGREVTRQLEIMRDSRSGVMGITALILNLLLKTSLLIVIKNNLLAMLCYGFIGKLILVITIVLFPYARKKGTGALFKAASYKHLLLCILYLPLFIFIIYSAKLVLVYAIIIAITLTLFIAYLINKRYKGLTGDCYGALHEISQILYLICIGALI